MSLQDTATHTTPEQESAVVGMPTADAAPGRFPTNIVASEVMTIRDLHQLVDEPSPDDAVCRAIGQPPPEPKGEVQAQHPAKSWLPCNERLATQLGHAQAALRLLDDQRALVKSCEVYADLVLIDLHRAPNDRKALWQHIYPEDDRIMVSADLAGANDTVLLRWPLEQAA